MKHTYRVGGTVYSPNRRTRKAKEQRHLLGVDPARPGVSFPHLSIISYGPNAAKVRHYLQDHEGRLEAYNRCIHTHSDTPSTPPNP